MRGSPAALSSIAPHRRCDLHGFSHNLQMPTETPSTTPPDRESRAGDPVRERLREQRDLALSERDAALRRLAEIEASAGYRLLALFWKLMRRLAPPGSWRGRLYRRLRGARPAASTPESFERGGNDDSVANDPWPELYAIEEQVTATHLPAVAILSTVWLLESEGQRPTQLALELARRGLPVAFCYWRWWPHEWAVQDRIDAGIVQLPIDLVLAHPERLVRAFSGHRQRIAIVAFPHPDFFELVAALHAAGWIVVYDVLDDWEEFHRVGQAVWYDEPFERHLLTGADAVFTVNDVLAERVRELGRDAVAVVGNGFRPGLEEVFSPRPLARGEVTAGYFGYLAGAWFDWALLAAAARKRPDWRFYLIGYGGAPEEITLPENVVLLGKQPQHALAAYAANWDVALVPFKPERLAAGADPIKTYEYLAMGLPVVVTGVYPPPGSEAFVTRTEGVDGFLAAIAHAARHQGADAKAARQRFAAGCTWAHRADALLDAIDRGEQRVAEKRALMRVER